MSASRCNFYRKLKIEAIRLAIAANVSRVETAAMVMICLVVCAAAWMTVALWRHAQHEKAARRVRDRLDQEADPEGWAWRQAQPGPRSRAHCRGTRRHAPRQLVRPPAALMAPHRPGTGPPGRPTCGGPLLLRSLSNGVGGIALVQ